MFIHNLDPVLFTLGPLSVRWYGIIYAFGFVLAYLMMPWLAKRKSIDFSSEDMGDLLFYIVLGVVIGSRLGYVVFYNLPVYVASPLSIFAVWQGGLSFHGGLIGTLVAGWLYCRKRNVGFYTLADLAVIPVSLALMLGRVGNFINGELVGRVTSVPWCFQFPGYEGCRHPSQLYESAKNFLIFLGLWQLNKKELKPGMLFWSFVVMYAVLRFFIEFVREPDVQLGFIFGLTMGQWLNIGMLVFGVYFLFKINYQES